MKISSLEERKAKHITQILTRAKQYDKTKTATFGGFNALYDITDA